MCPARGVIAVNPVCDFSEICSPYESLLALLWLLAVYQQAQQLLQSCC
jgi:hypothetical protein